ncbi:MAG: tetratricopeptide repeat protein [Candidatus Latescibacterota bacterium]
MKKIVPAKNSFDFRTIGIILALVLATVAVYGQVYNFDFINIDDNKYVYENYTILGGLNLKSVISSFTATQGAGLWIPVTWLSFLADLKLFGLNPGAFHLTNVFFHILNTLLLFALFRKLTGYVWRSAFVAALFALHPLHVESVAWITERKDVLSIFFMLGALYTYVKYTERLSLGKYVLTLALFCLGIMSKPMVITFPFILLLVDYWPLCRLHGFWKVSSQNSKGMSAAKVTNRRVLIEKIPFFLISAAASAITFVVAHRDNALLSVENYPLSQRIQESIISYVLYVWKTIVPQHLAVFYPHRSGEIPLGETACAFLVLVGITALVIRFSRRFSYLSFGWLWYLVTLLPVIGIFQAGEQRMADRFTYLPIIGLFVMGVWGISGSFNCWSRRKLILPILMSAVVLLYGSLAWIQVRYWKDSYTLLTHALAVTTDNSLAHNNLGLYLCAHGNIEEGLHHYKEALRIDPGQPEACSNVGSILFDQGKIDEAIVYFRKALEISPNFEKAHHNIAIAYDVQGRADEALIHYNEALKLNPGNYKLLRDIGVHWHKNGNYDKALWYYNEALKRNPSLAGMHYNIGIILNDEGKTDEALTFFKEELRLNPNFAEAHYYLGNVLVKQKKYDEAITHYNDAIKLKPDLVEAHKNLAYIYKNLGNNEAAAREENEVMRLIQQKQ